MKRKWWVLAQPPYYSSQGNCKLTQVGTRGRQASPRAHQGNWRQSPGWNRTGDRQSNEEDNPGSRYRQRFGGKTGPRAHSRYIRVQQVCHVRRPPGPPTNEPKLSSLNNYILGGWGVWVQMVGDLGTCARVILVCRECIWNAFVVLLVLPAFDDTGFLGSPSRQVVYSSDSTLGDCLPFPFEE